MRHPTLLALALLAACGGADEGDPSPTDTAPPEEQLDPRFAELAEAIEADLEANLATAAQVAVWMDGEVHYVGGFGTADPKGERAVGRDTLFMIGSDTKKITALSLLQKVEAGALDLDLTVAELLPELDMTYAPEFTDATVHELLSHQGGIVDGVDFQQATEDEALATFTYEDFASTFYPLAPPGRFWNYSNPNFSVAGLVDETIDGRAWPDIVAEDLFAPLGLTRTVPRKEAVDDDYAAGFGFDSLSDTEPGPVKLPKIWESAWTRPAGLVWSTASDQARLAAFLVDGDPEILDDTLREALTVEHTPTYPDLPGGYGYGVMLNQGLSLGADYYDVPVWSHGGNTFTHTSTFYVLPEQRFAVVILSNGYGDDFTGSAVAAMRSLAELPAPVPAPEPPTFDEAVVDSLVGTYHDPFNVGDMVISREAEGLRIDMPLLDQYGIPYEHELSFASNRVWMGVVQGLALDLSFIEGPDGEVWLRNRSFVGLRVPEMAFAPRSAPSREAVEAALRRLRIDPIPPLLRPRR